MKTLLIATGLFVAFTSTSLLAQSARVSANIPFDFQMGKTTMPAGEYTFNRDSKVLTIREVAGKHTVMVLTNPASRRTAPATGVVQFERYGDTYFLSALYTPDSADGIAVPQSASQKALAMRAAPSTTTVVARSGK